MKTIFLFFFFIQFGSTGCRLLHCLLGENDSLQYNLCSGTTQGSNKSGLLQQVVFKFRLCYVDLGRGVVSE